ncbi:hypothetical protein K2F54_17625 [Cryobacterium sp. 1639]|uniref:hypothetical protein n=1 Tax=Cryobacterium inferilacus TaxID=2866629 RepID=UPI001C73987C|nr:hypothetical protein [Cryobacterium sp. 1639]MBX0301787.1 hypothetical protein [Cryobacterium sp. 1639]
MESLQKGSRRLTSVTAFSTAVDDDTESEDPDTAPASSDAVTGTVSLLIDVLVNPAAEWPQK